ncbi:MAG: sulfoxide reductase heme-binding subunit YedZ [Polyangiales bacterium]|jgi:sulfoxide reductase heme-binding subunit YedZ
MSPGTTQTMRLRRALVATALIAFVSIGFAYASTEWAFARSFTMARISGWVAVVGLAFGLCVTPMSRVSRLSDLSAWRRAIGVCTAVAASVHVVLSLLGPLDGAWRAVLTWPYLSAGALAFLILALLLLTSFPRVIRALRIRHWKVLHRLVYAAAVFVVAHLMLSPWGSVLIKGVVSVVLVGALVFRILRRDLTS